MNPPGPGYCILVRFQHNFYAFFSTSIVTDHFTRVGKTGSGRVVGILLGKWTMGGTELDVSNSFALPFDEDSKDSNIWFLDHDYLESMFAVSSTPYFLPFINVFRCSKR